MKQKVFMLVWDMDIYKGGINRVMLQRSAMLAEKYDVELLTLDFKMNYNEISKKLLEMGRLHPQVIIKNVHDYYKTKFSSKDQIDDKQVTYFKHQTQLYEEGYEVQDNEIKSKNCARYFKNGQYIKYKKWDDEGYLTHIDYFNENRYRICREYFMKNGHMYKKTFFSYNTNKPVQDLFYTTDGKCFLNKWYDPEKGSITNVFLINPSTKKATKFNSNHEFNRYWLKELSMLSPTKPIVICDGPGSAKIPLELSNDYIYKIFVIHSNHYKKPYIPGSQIKENHIDMLENIKKMDALVLLTDTQKKHIIEQFGNYNNIHVIPHFIKPFKKEKLKTKDEKLVTMVARYHPEKRIDAAILAFKEVIRQKPDARLEIYGEGNDRKRLTELINENGLQNHVFLKGYVNEVETVFSKSIVSLLTSYYEGFSLVILESMASKTPVISFDVPYGPKEIIVDGENGYLIKNGEIKSLAEKIIYLLKNPKKAGKMGENAYHYVLNKYSHENQEKYWLDLLSKFSPN